MSKLTLNEYQIAAEKTAVYPGRGGIPIYAALGLAGEAGEVCDHIKKAIRDDGGEINPGRLELLLYELGDILWYVSEMATCLDMSLEDVAKANIEKLDSRLERGVIGGSGDKR